jgi:hypothetical protein
MNEPIALESEFSRCGGNVRYLELDAGLGYGDISGPFSATKTCTRCFRKRPQPEVVYPFERVGEYTVAVLALE